MSEGIKNYVKIKHIGTALISYYVHLLMAACVAARRNKPEYLHLSHRENFNSYRVHHFFSVHEMNVYTVLLHSNSFKILHYQLFAFSLRTLRYI